MIMKIIASLVIIVAILSNTQAITYDQCQFVRDLPGLGVPQDQVAVWTCIAKFESNFDTHAVNPTTGDHGILQISELFWCSTSGSGGGCNKPCSAFEDDDIADDVACALTVFNEHQRLKGNGFMAWTTYEPNCAGDVSSYVAGC